jgi:hypothetical protein
MVFLPRAFEANQQLHRPLFLRLLLEILSFQLAPPVKPVGHPSVKGEA